MKEIARTEFLQMLEARVESQLQRAISIIQNLDSETLLRPSAKGGWSIVQCLWHLNSYGDFYLPKIKEALQSRSNSPTYKSGWLGNYFANLMEPGNSSKFKAFRGHIPPSDLDPHPVVAEFIVQLESMLKYLKEAEHADLNTRLPISISKIVRLKLGDVFRFLVAHNERHLQQALSLRR